MIYFPKDVHPECKVLDESGGEVPDVLSIDVQNKLLVLAERPHRIEKDEFATFGMSFDSVDIEYHPTLVWPHNLERLPMRFTFHGLRRIEQ